MTKMRMATVGIAAVAFFGWSRCLQTGISGLVTGAEPESPILAQFDFDPEEPQVTVPFEMATDRYRFGLFTRAASSFGKFFAKTLPRCPPEFDTPDDLELAFRSTPHVTLGGLALRFPRPSVACELSPLGNQRFLQSDAVAGLDVLVHHVLQIDFDERKIRFLRAIPGDPGERFEICSLKKTPRLCAVTIKAQCCSEPVQEFSVELESPDAIYLHSSVCARLLEKGEFHRPHDESAFDSSVTGSVRVATVDSFTVGPFRTAAIRAVVHRDNVIGLGYLSRFVVTFDFPNAALYLRPGKQFDRVDGYDLSGLFGRMTDDALEVEFCRLQSAAYEAGLQDMDVILDIDGQPVNVKSQTGFRKKMRQDGSTVRVHFKRDGVHQNVEMKLPTRPKDAPGPDPEPRRRVRDNIPIFHLRAAPSELLEPELPDEPQDAARTRAPRRRKGDAALCS